MKNSKESIFVVDDDQGILDSFDVMLGDEYNLVMIDNGTEAIELLGKENRGTVFAQEIHGQRKELAAVHDRTRH